MAERFFEYDICLSFAGDNRDFVEAVARGLRERGIRVFYDDYETVELGEGPLRSPSLRLQQGRQVLCSFRVGDLCGQGLADP